MRSPAKRRRNHQRHVPWRQHKGHMYPAQRVERARARDVRQAPLVDVDEPDPEQTEETDAT